MRLNMQRNAFLVLFAFASFSGEGLAAIFGSATDSAGSAADSPPAVADQPSTAPRAPLLGIHEKEKEVETAALKYGVDVSFPIHHELRRGTFQAKRYSDYMAGCYAKYSRGACEGSEFARKQLNRVQPPTQQNYTEQGFAHVKAPAGAIEALQRFFAAHNSSAAPEQWPAGNTYTNHWEEPTLMLSLEAREFSHEGRKLKAQVWDEVRDALQEWTGEKLRPTSLYGIRSYQKGAMLAPHVDRLPLVTSAIINVAQDLDEPWPVEIYTHAGEAVNVSMAPGDMVMYESHTCVHGRPAPLKGRFFANVFVHFEPIDSAGHQKNEGSSESMKYPPPHHDANRAQQGGGLRGGDLASGGLKYYQHVDHDHAVPDPAAAERALAEALEKRAGGPPPPKQNNHQNNNNKPLHMMASLARTREAKRQGKEGHIAAQADWGVEGHGSGEEAADEEAREEKAAAFATGSTPLHSLAAEGDLEGVQAALKGGADVNQGDSNLWHPLHEAARGGHLAVVKELVNAGADVGATTLQGGSALWWARETHGEKHAVVRFLQSIGAPDVADVEEL